MTNARCRRGLAVLAALVAVNFPGPSAAGPPYVTDDPEPTDTGHYEVYFFASGSHVPGSTTGATGVDFNYGAAPDVQLTATFPLAFERGEESHTGPGNMELAAKYKFVHQADAPGLPDLGVFPRLFLPTGGHRFGSGRLSLLLPLWAQWDFGPWSLFGGGGYTLNPGDGERDYCTTGAVVSRAIGKTASLGLELYHRGPDAADARRYTGFNVGGSVKLATHWSLIGAAGSGLDNPRQGGQFNAYVALKLDY